MEVVGVISFALAGAKNIYKTITAIKDATPAVKRLSDKLESLCTFLQRLQSSKVFVDPRVDLRGLLAAINDCNRDVQRYHQVLGKLQQSPSDGSSTRTLKSFRAFWSEDKLLQIVQEVQYHCDCLGNHLSLLQLDTGYALQSDTIQELHDVFSIQLHDVFSIQAARDERQERVLLQQHDDMQNIRSRALPVMQHSINGITQKLDLIPQMSSVQHEDVMDLLKNLHAQMATLNLRAGHVESTTSRIVPSTVLSKARVDSASLGRGNELASTFKRLYKLASRGGGTAHSEEARVVIDDLTALLDSMKDMLTRDYSQTDQTHEGSIEEHLAQRELKRLSGILMSSDIVNLNSTSISPRKVVGETPKFVQKHTYAKVSTGHYVADLIITKRKATGFSHGSGFEGQTAIETAAKIKSLIKHGKYQAVLNLQLRHIQSMHGSFSPAPSITIGKILPDDDPVFQIVEYGKVEKLQSLISRHQITLRERDPWGTPLLHYAMKKPRMCKFLLENGADVDEIAPQSIDGEREFIHTPLATMLNPYDSKKGTGECKRLLLDHGTDPSLIVDGTIRKSALWIIACHGEPEHLDLVLRLGGPLIDLEARDDLGDTLILAMVGNWSNGMDKHNLHKLQMILRAGADIHAKNNRDETVLHVAFVNASSRVLNRYADEAFNSWAVGISCLVDLEVNIDALDDQGFSASHWAYTPQVEASGFLGDLWDAILCRHGYDIYSRRRKHPRIPLYTEGYQRKRFESLWVGREQQCPYYDDPPYWCHHMRRSEQTTTGSRSGPLLHTAGGKQWYECDDCTQEGAGCLECEYGTVGCWQCGEAGSLRCCVCKVGPRVCRNCGAEDEDDEECDEEDETSERDETNGRIESEEQDGEVGDIWQSIAEDDS